MSSSARISFTAHYTGHVWHRLGLSDPALQTTGGHALFTALRPAMATGRLLGGGRDLASMLAQRHVLLDALLDAAIERGDVTQVLEIAAGLSPRALRFRQKFAHLRYVEADLPAMAAEKRRRLSGRLGPLHQVVTVDALAHRGPQTLAKLWTHALDPRQPTAVIMEGLIHYLPRAALLDMFTRLHALQSPAGGVLLTDVAVMPTDALGQVGTRAFLRVLGVATRGRVDMHQDGGGLDALLRQAGYASVAAHDPDLELATAPHRTRAPSLVRVLVARP